MNRNLLLPTAAAAGLATLPLLALLVYYGQNSTSGVAAAIASQGTIIPALFFVFVILYFAIGTMQGANTHRSSRAVPRKWRSTAIMVFAVAGPVSTITWLLWFRGEGWPVADAWSYVSLLTSIAVLWVMLMPGALLQVWLLGRLHPAT